MNQKLIIFLKYPEVGKVKTRLATAVGAAQAACIYKKLVEDTVDTIRPLAGKSADVMIFFDPPERATDVKNWLHGHFQYCAQGNGDLGERMSSAAQAAFKDGASKIVMIGTDCPEMDLFTVNRAFWALSRKEAVLGPTEDGGYYLVGINNVSSARIFENIPWSTPQVFQKTFEKIKNLGLSLETLPMKADVDTVEDWNRWIQSKRNYACEKSVSVIIPVLNEEKNIVSLLKDLQERHKPEEIIVVDGGSSDKTCEFASQSAKVIHSERGRAHQMNAGAAVANGDIFLFLHADTKLPDRAIKKIKAVLKDGSKQSGRFRMSFGHPHPLLRFYQSCTRFHFFSYGDQAFFVTKEMFLKLEGFSAEAPFEDIDFYRRLLKIEEPVILKDAVITSPRRFFQNGIIRQKLINIGLASMVYFGFKNSWIHRFKKSWYRDTREHGKLQSA